MLLGLELVWPSATSASMRRTPEADGSLGEHRDAANVTGRGHVGATAQLTVKPVTDGHDANLGTVLLTKQRDRASFTRGIEAHDLGGHGQILGELLVDESLNVAQLRALKSGSVTEVETQAGWRILRTRLGGVPETTRAAPA